MKATRNSSFELLRIILIIMILVEHGNMWFIGSGYQSEPEHLVKCAVQSICIGSVNAFILISGWFGIRSGLRKIGDLAFMLLFTTLPILVLALTMRWLPISALTSIEGFYEYVLGGNGYWFVVDYIGLIIISPLLNKGFDALERTQVVQLLTVGYALIAFYDFALRTPVLGSEGGYSLIWFGYLYLLARYMRIYGVDSLDRYRWPLFILAITVQTILLFFGAIGLRYTNPLILIEAVSIIAIFKHWQFYNKVINYVASGVLMAYLLHMQPVFIPYIRRFLAVEYQELGYWLYMTEVVVLSIGVFLVAIPLNRLQSTMYHKLKSCLSL